MSSCVFEPLLGKITSEMSLKSQRIRVKKFCENADVLICQNQNTINISTHFSVSRSNKEFKNIGIPLYMRPPLGTEESAHAGEGGHGDSKIILQHVAKMIFHHKNSRTFKII